MSRSLGGTDTGLSVSSVLVSERELTQISADHVELDFNNVEGLSVVDSNEAADHFGHDDGIPKMSFNGDWLLSWGGVGLGLLALQVESVVSVLDFFVMHEILLAKRRLILALKSSTTCSWVSSLSCSGV